MSNCSKRTKAELNTSGEICVSAEQQWRLEKIALLGRLSVGIVHDFNHVLNVVRGYCELLMTDQLESAAAREKLLQIRKAADQGAFLTQQLLSFSRGESPKPMLPAQLVRFPSTRLKGKKPLSASILVQKYLRPAAVKAGILAKAQKVRFGFHNFRHSLASALVKMKVDPKTVQEFLRQAHVTTTLQLYAQSDMEAKRDAQGKFLEQLLGDKIHLLTERIQ